MGGCQVAGYSCLTNRPPLGDSLLAVTAPVAIAHSDSQFQQQSMTAPSSRAPTGGAAGTEGQGDAPHRAAAGPGRGTGPPRRRCSRSGAPPDARLGRPPRCRGSPAGGGGGRGGGGRRGGFIPHRCCVSSGGHGHGRVTLTRSVAGHRTGAALSHVGGSVPPLVGPG